jgi:hypothetical protein
MNEDPKRQEPSLAVTSEKQALLTFRFCKEFGWKPEEVEKIPVKLMHSFVVILNELDRQTLAQLDKGKGT